MRTALVQRLSDFLSVIAFLIVYGGTDNLYLATGAAIAVSVAQFVFFKIRGQSADAMQWLILGMMVVLGAAALITEDSRFVMVNIVVALTLTFGAWAWFISVGAVGAKVVAFLTQYAVFRMIFRRTRIAAAARDPATL